MPIFKSVRFKNLFCYGNEQQEIYFDDSPTMWQIIGRNGVGKSTLIRVFKIGWYLENDGVVTDAIANQINKNGEIEICAESNGVAWRIKTTFSPNKISVYKGDNTEPEDWGKLSDTKKRWLKEAIDMPYYIFNNTVSLSINDFKSFLSMKPTDSRNIRDRIFGFYVVNEMGELLRPKIYEINSDLDTIKSKISNTSENLITSQKEYDDLKISIGDGNEEQIKTLEDEIKVLDNSLISLRTKRDDISEKYGEKKLRVDFIINEIKKKAVVDATKKMTILKEEIKKIEDESNEKILKKSSILSEKKLFQSMTSIKKLEEISGEVKVMEEDMLGYRADIDELTHSIKELQTLLDTNKNIHKLIKQKKQLQVDATNLSNLLISYKTLLATKEKAKIFFEEADVRKKKLGDDISNLESDKKEIQKKITAHENGICSECGTDLTTKEHTDQLDNHKADISIIDSKLATLELANIKLLEGCNKAKESEKKILGTIDETFRSIINLKPDGVYDEIFSDVFTKMSSAIIITNNTTSADFDLEDFMLLLEKINLSGDDIDLEESNKVLEDKKKVLETTENLKKDIDTKISGSKESIRIIKEDIGDIKSEDIKAVKFQYQTSSEYEKKIEDIISDYDKLISNKSIKSAEIGGLEGRLEEIKSQIKNDPRFWDMTFDSIKAYINPEIGMKENIENMKDEMMKEQTTIDTLKKDIDIASEDVFRKNYSLKSLKSGDHLDVQLAGIQNIVNRFNEDIAKYNKESDILTDNSNFYKMVQYVLSDEGIKSFILKDIVPSINTEIANILEVIGVPIQPMFDEEFSVHLFRFGEEVGVSTISTGQIKMIDSSILLAITTILKMKYNFNVVFYDEVFSSIDSDNRITLLEIFRAVCVEKLKLQTFVINHAYMPSSYFGKIVKITNNNNFSNMDVISRSDYEMRYLKTVDKDETDDKDKFVSLLETFGDRQ
jgi:DNA repair exonuclease SbcCD ATPase subunit